jgi:hypothetical protein
VKIKIKRQLKEQSGVAGIQGSAGVPISSKGEIEKHNKNEEELSKLKGRKMEEALNSSGLTGGVRIGILKAKDEYAGMKERGLQMGLQNFKESVEDDLVFGPDDNTIDLNKPDAMDRIEKALKDDPEEETEAQKNYRPFYEEALKHGYKLDKVLGAGQFGSVFSAEDLNTGGEYVIKVVGWGENTNVYQEDIDREIRNYETVSQAAEGNEEIWKHFPQTYETWKFKGPMNLDLGFIVMERLVPLTSAESAFIPDLNYLIARKKPWDVAVAGDYGEGRDQTIKAKWYVQNELDSLSWDAEMAFAKVTNEYEYGTNKELDDIAASIHPTRLGRYERMHSDSPEKIQTLIQRRLEFAQNNLEDRLLFTFTDYYQIMRDEVQDAPYAILILLDLMTAIAKGGIFSKVNEIVIQNNIQSVATSFINGYRKAVGIPLSFNARDIEQDEKTRANYHSPGRDLFKAIQLLHKETGLIAKDVHDENVMKREGGGDIVIVDLGLFRMDPSFASEEEEEEDDGLLETITKGRGYRIKILTNR